jgi:hypothetical protein
MPSTGVCASPNTLIATPDGERAIAGLREGDLVYSVDRDMIRAVPILRATKTPVSLHHVLRIVLANGRTLEISPDHPMSDGQALSSLSEEKMLDGQQVHSIQLIPYAHEATYDILPASDTGTYFASGVRIGSTLFAGNWSQSRREPLQP